MCELQCTVIITVKKGNIINIVYIMHDVSHEILILDTVYYYTGRFIKNQQKYAKTNTVIYKCMEK